MPYRTSPRHNVCIPVQVVSVTDRHAGTIIDLTAEGAHIIGPSLPARTQCQIEFEGQTVYGTVMWSDPSRIGVRFPFELVDGPLHRALISAVPGVLPGVTRPNPRPARGRDFGRRGL